MGFTGQLLFVGLTPAWQVVGEFEALHTGDVNRAMRVTSCAAGKGPNGARACRLLGGRPWLVGFAGGHTGARLLHDLRDRGVRLAVTGTVHETRTCYTVIDRSAGTVTELVEEAALPARAEWAAFREAFRNRLAHCAGVVIAGAPMPDAPTGMYAALSREAHRLRVPVFLDTRGEPLQRALPERPLVAKLNRAELAATLGRPIAGEPELLRGARRVLSAGAQRAVVTDGSRGAWLVCAGEAWHFRPPRVGVLNSIGAGDAMTAAIAIAMTRGEPPLDAVRFGVACATASVQTLLPAQLALAEAGRILPRIRVRRLG